MISSLSLDRSQSLPSMQPQALFPKQNAVSKIFARAVDANPNAIEMNIASHPLWKDPIQIFMGGMWSFCCAFYALLSVQSLADLYDAIRVENSSSKKWEKIGLAIKKVFSDGVGLGGSVAYVIHWAHEVKWIALGSKALIVQGLGMGSSVISSAIESGTAIYQIHTEKNAILSARNPEEQEKHKQYLCLSLMKLISNVSMVAWTVFGIATLAAGVAFSPFLTGTLFGVSTVFSTCAFFYEWKLENWKEWLPYPVLNRA
jgi:hypothetical protein